MTENDRVAENRTVEAFTITVVSSDYRAAANIIASVVNAGDVDLAALLLEGTVSAGQEAIRKASSPVTVTQTVGNIPAGATVVGYSGRL